MKGLKREDIIPVKDGLINLERGLAFKKGNRTSSFCCQEAAGEFPNTIKITEEKLRYVP